MVEPDGDTVTNCNWHAKNSSQGPRKEDGGIGNKRMNWDNLDHSIVKTG